MVFGLVGAYTWLLWDRAQGDPARQRRAFGLIGMLMLARFGFGLLAEVGHGWIADLAAFGVGFALMAATRPGSGARLRARLRQRG
jgi:rhomboid protease GluP